MMHISSISIVLLFIQSITISKGTLCPGILNIDNQQENNHIITSIINGGKVFNNGLSLTPWSRVHFGTQNGCRKYGKVKKNDLYQFKLLGNKIQYSIDLSTVRLLLLRQIHSYYCDSFV